MYTYFYIYIYTFKKIRQKLLELELLNIFLSLSSPRNRYQNIPLHLMRLARYHARSLLVKADHSAKLGLNHKWADCQNEECSQQADLFQMGLRCLPWGICFLLFNSLKTGSQSSVLLTLLKPAVPPLPTHTGLMQAYFHWPWSFTWIRGKTETNLFTLMAHSQI